MADEPGASPSSPAATARRRGARAASARVATMNDAEAMGAMFARAFADDPVWGWMCRARIARFSRLAAPFFAAETRQHLRHSSAWTTPGANAGALWVPPGTPRLTVADMARWAPSALRLFGRHLPRSLSALQTVDRVHPREPHWYLALLGTDPDHQGTGLGSAVLAPVLERCDTDSVPAYLESSKEANLAFYARHGFEVAGRVDMGGAGNGPPMWTMWREPRLPGS